MSEPTEKLPVGKLPLFAAGLSLFIVLPISIGFAATGAWPVLGMAVLFPVLFYTVFRSAGAIARRQFMRAYTNASPIVADELPANAHVSGRIVRDIMDSPGTVDYQDGALTFTAMVGADETIPLDQIQSFRMTPDFNGSWRPGFVGIALKSPNHSRLGFRVTEIEPWRSILASVCENKTFEDTSNWIWK